MKKKIIQIHIPKTGGSWQRNVLEEYAPDHFLGTSQGNGNRCWDEEVLHWRGKWNPPSKFHFSGTSGWLHQEQSKRFEGESFDIWENAHKVAICRNPFDLLVSQYHFDDPDNQHLDKVRHYLPDGVATGAGLANLRHGITSFDEYLEKYCDPHFPWDGGGEAESEARYFQFHQAFNSDGTCGVDTFIRNEKLSLGTAEMLLKLGHIDSQTFEGIVNSSRKNVGRLRKGKDYRSFYTDAQREMVERKFKAELLLFGYDFDGPTDDSPFVDPDSLFYHPIVPTAGKHLGKELCGHVDRCLRQWIESNDTNRDESGSFNARGEWALLTYIRESQSIFPDVWCRLPGVEFRQQFKGSDTETTYRNPIIHVLNNPLSLKIVLDKYWSNEVCEEHQTLNCESFWYDKDSFLYTLTDPGAPYADHCAREYWRVPEDLNHVAFWQGPSLIEILPQIQRMLLMGKKA